MVNTKKKKIVIASGYYNPLHVGHVNFFKEAKKLGDFLIVIINNDEQVKIKGSTSFMTEAERSEIVKAIKYVDDIFLSIDRDRSVCKSLRKISQKYKDSELFFANGGDRNTNNIPEFDVCKEFDIKMIDNVGGVKIQSSSWLLKAVK